MVIIFRAISGGGKTTLGDLLVSADFKFNVGPDLKADPAMSPAVEHCRILWNSIINFKNGGSNLHRVSADDFFMVNGEYKFDPKMLGTAHAACLRHFNEVVKNYKDIIIVDNTNTTIAEFVPYAALANAYAHELHILTLVVSPVEAWTRNKHGTPFANVVKQAYNLEKSIVEMPPWFPQQVFPTGRGC